METCESMTNWVSRPGRNGSRIKYVITVLYVHRNRMAY